MCNVYRVCLDVCFSGGLLCFLSLRLDCLLMVWHVRLCMCACLLVCRVFVLAMAIWVPAPATSCTAKRVLLVGFSSSVQLVFDVVVHGMCSPSSVSGCDCIGLVFVYVSGSPYRCQLVVESGVLVCVSYVCLCGSYVCLRARVSVWCVGFVGSVVLECPRSVLLANLIVTFSGEQFKKQKNVSCCSVCVLLCLPCLPVSALSACVCILVCDMQRVCLFMLILI